MPYYPYQTYQPPMPDQLAQYRQQQYQPQPMFQQPAQQPAPDYVTRQEFEALQARIEALTAPKPSSRKASPAKEEEANA